MTDFIPFPSPSGNPKQIAADYFEVNQKIKTAGTLASGVHSVEEEATDLIYPAPATLSVDRTPYVLVTYAANGSSAASTPEIAYYLGMTGSNSTDFQDYTKTPLTSASQSDFDDNTKNGTLLYMQDKVITPMAYDTVDAAQSARQQKFKRFIFINPGGFINVDGETPLFPPAAGSLLEQTEFRVGTETDGASSATAFLSSDPRNTTGQDGYVPTPFTTGGRAVGSAPTGEPGDRKKAWAAAIDYLHNTVSGSEAIAYIGYDVVYTDTNYDTFKTSDSAINQASANAVWQRARPERAFGSFRYAEWKKLEEAGFDVTGYDTGGRIYFDSNAPLEKESGFSYSEEPDSRVWDSFVNNAGSRTQVEAVARDLATGAQLTGDDAGTYTTVRAWTIASQLVQIDDEETGAQLTASSNNQNANYWLLDPATTETHVIMRWSDWTAKTVAEYQKAVWTVFHRGWIPGVSAAAVGFTSEHKDFIDYVAQVNQLNPLADNSANSLNPYTLGAEWYPFLDQHKVGVRWHNYDDPTASFTFVSASQWNTDGGFQCVGHAQETSGAVSSTTSPRLRFGGNPAGIGYDCISVDVNFTSEAQRDAWLTTWGKANTRLRLRLSGTGLSEDVLTMTVAEAEASVVEGNATWEATPTGNGFLRLLVPTSSFANPPATNGSGLGALQNWSADMQCQVDLIVGDGYLAP
jgi:hypothetical protein